MTTITVTHYLVLAAALFAIGLIGVLSRRNVIVVFMSIELMLNAVTINLAAFARQWGQTSGQIFALFVLVVAAAEAVVGLAIVLALFRNRQTLDIDAMRILRG